jgi:FKBP-type peptidyl-prolyl cis-trans isomerase FkpA
LKLYKIYHKTNSMNKRNSYLIISLISTVVLISVLSCDPGKEYEKKEKSQIQDFLAKYPDLNYVKMPSGLYYLEVAKGTGISPVVNDSAFVRYEAAYIDGTIFETNMTTGPVYGFVVGTSIPGFDEGVMLMGIGGKSTLLIPSALAYGTMGKYPIPGYTPLLFNIQLIDVKRAASK